MNPDNLTNEELIEILKRRGVTLSEVSKLFQQPKKEVKNIGELEIQSTAEALYLNNTNGRTILRIKGLPTPIPQLKDISGNMFDINYGIGINWRSST